MDSQAIIERIQQGVKDKTLLVRFYNLQNGTDIWIDGLSWRIHDFNMYDYLKEEFGIDEYDSVKLSYDILDADSEVVKKTCFRKGLFSMAAYDLLNDELVEMSDDAILAGIELGIELDGMSDKYRGHYKSFEEYVQQTYTETCDEDVRKVLKYFDWSVVAEEWEQQYSHHEGFVFDATR